MRIKPDYDKDIDSFYCSCGASVYLNESYCPDCCNRLDWDTTSLIFDEKMNDYACLECRTVNALSAPYCKECGLIFDAIYECEPDDYGKEVEE